MTSIYKVWLMNYRPAWYELGKSAQDELTGKVYESLGKVGGKVLLIAASLWADEKWAGWGIEEYPNIEGVIQHAQTIWEHQWYRYVKSWSTLGTLFEPGLEVVIPKAPLYKLAFMNMTDAQYGLSEAEQANWGKKHEELYKQFGVKNILGCASAWSNEAWLGWMLESYPSLEAVQAFRMQTYEAGWYQYTEATSVLGIKYPPE
jgi:hypothetical protein